VWKTKEWIGREEKRRKKKHRFLIVTTEETNWRAPGRRETAATSTQKNKLWRRERDYAGLKQFGSGEAKNGTHRRRKFAENSRAARERGQNGGLTRKGAQVE